MAGRFRDHDRRASPGGRAERPVLARRIREVQELGAFFSDLEERRGTSDRSGIAVQMATRAEDVRTLAAALDENRAALMAENASLEQEEQALLHEIRILRQYAHLAYVLGDLLDRHIASIAMTDDEAGRVLKTEALLPVRQRRRDLLLQLTVAANARAAIRQVRKSNVDAVRALRSATTTLLTALRTAGLAARADSDDR
jgi:uncharacterized protein YaaN involved in tellurite resistance